MSSFTAESSGFLQVKDFLGRISYRMRAWMLEMSFNPSLGRITSAWLFLISLILRWFLPGPSLKLLLLSHSELMRAGQSGSLASRLNSMIEHVIRHACEPGGLVEHVTAGQTRRQMDREAMTAGIVLKAPRCENGQVAEKGVLLLKNSDWLDSFRRSVDVGAALLNYVLVLEPSWAGHADSRLLPYTVFRNHPILVMSPWPADYEFFQRLKSNLRPIAIGSSDWVNPQIFRPIPEQAKQYDAVMISRWTFFKRFHVLFRAIRQINDPTYRVAIIGAITSQATDRQIILSMIDKQGLREQITVIENLTPAEVNLVLNQSKVNVLLSRQEGGNRALSEGFFAGVPGLAIRNSIGILDAYFNSQTGRLISEDELAEALLYFREHWMEFTPRPWALQNIAPEVTTAKLNLHLKELAGRQGKPWTRDIVAKCNCPFLQYYPDESVGAGLPPADHSIADFPV